MDKHSLLSQNFQALLDDGIKKTTQLLNLLVQEYHLLQHSNPEQLEEIISEKDQLLKILKVFVDDQNNLLRHMGYSGDPAGIHQYFDDNVDDKQIRALWFELQQNIKSCQKQNEINSGLITLNQRQTTNTLDLLYGLAAGEKTYGPKGESRNTRPSNSFGKA
jgi:flagellar biosynthesis/type III secretory pathway chaperone